MPRFLAFVAVIAACLLSVACCSDAPQRVPVSAVALPAAAPCPPPAAAPCGQAAASVAVTEQRYQLVTPAPVAVEFRTGVEEHMRAGLAVPPEMLKCLTVAGSKIVLSAIEGVQCALQALIPHVTPSQRFLYADPAAAAAPCPPAALPVTPPPTAAPCK